MLTDNLIEQDQDIVGGTPVFANTRVPVKTMLDYLAAGQTLDEFLDDFPTVERSTALGVIVLIAHDTRLETLRPLMPKSWLRW